MNRRQTIDYIYAIRVINNLFTLAAGKENNLINYFPIFIERCKTLVYEQVLILSKIYKFCCGNENLKFLCKTKCTDETKVEVFFHGKKILTLGE